jgi:hypothetical protein
LSPFGTHVQEIFVNKKLLFDTSRCIQSVSRCNKALSYVYVLNSSHPSFDLAYLANALKKVIIDLQRLIPETDVTMPDLKFTFDFFESQLPEAALEKVLLVLLNLE